MRRLRGCSGHVEEGGTPKHSIKHASTHGPLQYTHMCDQEAGEGQQYKHDEGEQHDGVGGGPGDDGTQQADALACDLQEVWGQPVSVSVIAYAVVMCMGEERQDVAQQVGKREAQGESQRQVHPWFHPAPSRFRFKALT